MTKQDKSALHRFSFDYTVYNEFEKTIGPIEERVIKEDFKSMLRGNDGYDDKSKPEMDHFFHIFRHGWICARLAMEQSK